MPVDNFLVGHSMTTQINQNQPNTKPSKTNQANQNQPKPQTKNSKPRTVRFTHIKTILKSKSNRVRFAHQTVIQNLKQIASLTIRRSW